MVCCWDWDFFWVFFMLVSKLLLLLHHHTVSLGAHDDVSFVFPLYSVVFCVVSL